jgi:hypothetical protein
MLVKYIPKHGVIIMAKPNFEKLKAVCIDGIATQVPEKTRILDVVSDDVTAVEAFNPVAGKMELITRDRFNQNIPDGMTTHLTSIEKGGITFLEIFHV